MSTPARLWLYLALGALIFVHLPLQAQEQPTIDPPTASDSVQTTWGTLLEDRLGELDDVRQDMATVRTYLVQVRQPLFARLPGMEEEFKQLAAIAQVSRQSPGELTVVVERTRRLLDELNGLTAELEGSGTDLAGRLDQLQTLEANAPESATQVMQNFHDQLALARQQLTSLQQAIANTLAPAAVLRTEMQTLRDSLNSEMPGLWRDYYLSPSGRLFDPTGWSNELGRLHSAADILSLRLDTDFPQGTRAWFFVGVRAMAAFLLISSLLYFARRAIVRAPEDLRPGLTRIARNSARWLALGMALHYAAWSGGKLYQVIASLGTLCLCWGQMTLAWDLYSFCHVTRDRISPLWPMFLPMLVGMALLFLDPFPQLLAGLWLVYVAVILGQGNRRPRPEDAFSRYLLYGFAAMCWLSLALTLFGLSRLSILLCMAYTALAVCLQQDLSLIQLGNKIEEKLPQQGRGAVAKRLIVALAVPTVLLLATLTPVLWILAYPGGAYLLRHVANLGFSVGQVSLNAMQVLSIFIAFYLTRSFITVGVTFINGLRKQKGTRISSAVLGPVRTAYTYMLWAFFGLYVLRSIGFSLTSLAVLAGGLGVGVGLGLQNMVQNFISGMTIIFGQIIKEGDIVDVAGFTGTVRRINIRATEVETFDSATVFVPNGNFLSNTFTNWTHNGRMARRDITVSIAYDSDVPLSMKLLRDVAAANPKVAKNPAPAVNFTDFGPSAINLQLLFWVREYLDGSPALTEVRLKINEVFAQNGIEISFPQAMDVYIKETPPKEALPAATT